MNESLSQLHSNETNINVVTYYQMYLRTIRQGHKRYYCCNFAVFEPQTLRIENSDEDHYTILLTPSTAFLSCSEFLISYFFAHR